MPKNTKHFKNCLGVFQGGGCKALAFVGAFKEARESGVFFSQVAGTSAGSIVAALVAAGASPEYLENAVLETEFANFKRPVDKHISGGSHYIARTLSKMATKKVRLVVKFLRRLGLFSSEEIEVWVEKHLRALLNVTSEKKITFADLNIPLHIVATELGKSAPVIWDLESTPNSSVSYAVRCSCTIPVFFQPVDAKYVDGGVLSNLPAFVLNRSRGKTYEKLLCFMFSDDASVEVSPINVDSGVERQSAVLDAETYLMQLASAIIDGAVTIQAGLQDGLHAIRIDRLPLGTVDFDKINKQSIQEMFVAGQTAARNFFESEAVNLRGREGNRRVLFTEPEALNCIVREEAASGDEVIISLASTRYVYNLFPTLLHWRLNGSGLTFICSASLVQGNTNEAMHERFRRLVLDGLGAKVVVRDELPIEGCFFRRRQGMGSAIIFNEKRASESRACFATKYDKTYDSVAISTMFSVLRPLIDGQAGGLGSSSFSLVRAGLDVLVERLKTIEQYSGDQVVMGIEEVDVRRIVFLTKYVKSYKYSQIERLFRIYRQLGFDLFESVAIEYRSSDGNVVMPVTPPVAEKHGDFFYLFEGNSRLTYMIKEMSAQRLKLLVVRNVSAAFPSTGRFGPNQLLISDEGRIGRDRYKDWNKEHYRDIEAVIRRPSIYLSVLN
jgi:predicted acylesterase/phospholipase RssA